MRELLLKPLSWRLRSSWMKGQLTIWSFVVLGTLATSLLMHYSTAHISSTLPTIAIGINGTGLLLGGFVAGHHTGRKGWLYGGIQGILYSLSLLLISFLAFDASMKINPLLFTTFSFGISAIGGIVGMNLKR